MQTQVIVELEEGSLTVTVAELSPRVTKVLHCLRVPLADLTRDAVTNALRGISEEVLLAAPGVHVVFGERRIQHYVSTVPKLSPADVVAFMVREALRLTGMPSEDDVLVATRILRKLPGGRFVLSATAVAKNIWEPIHDAFRAAGVEVLSLHSMESCLALAAKPVAGGHVAVLECNTGRARFVMCDGDAPVQVRRILIGGASSSSSGALAAQLAMELPRTVDWLRETGAAVPKVLLLGTRVGLGEDEIGMVRGDLEEVRFAPTALELTEGQQSPGLGVAMLLQAIAARKLPASLLLRPSIKVPYGSTQLLGLAAVVVAGLACSWSAVINGREFLAMHHRVDVVEAENARLNHELASLARESAGAGPVDTVADMLESVLDLRRPVSRLIAEVSNAASEVIHLDELKFASTDRVVVTGVVQASSRKAALTAMADFTRQLRQLPYLESSGQEEVGEVAGQPNCFRFRLLMSWRSL